MAIAPTRRGGGCGTWLIGQLMAVGVSALGVSECSLYVNQGNRAAIALYGRLGFVRRVHPDPIPEAAASYYMVKGTL